MGIAAILLALALGACGSGSDHPTTASAAGATSATPATSSATTPLDTKRVERAIVASIKAQRKVTAHVTCPASVPQLKGVQFKCHAQSSIGKATFLVTQTDDQGHVTYVAK
jgi:Domain of unknown function (DUF4333)